MTIDFTRTSPNISYLCPWCSKYFQIATLTLERSEPVNDGKRLVSMRIDIKPTIKHWCEEHLAEER